MKKKIVIAVVVIITAAVAYGLYENQKRVADRVRFADGLTIDMRVISDKYDINTGKGFSVPICGHAVAVATGFNGTTLQIFSPAVEHDVVRVAIHFYFVGNLAEYIKYWGFSTVIVTDGKNKWEYKQ